MCQALDWVIGGEENRIQWVSLQSRELLRKDGQFRDNHTRPHLLGSGFHKVITRG